MFIWQRMNNMSYIINWFALPVHDKQMVIILFNNDQLRMFMFVLFPMPSQQSHNKLNESALSSVKCLHHCSYE